MWICTSIPSLPRDFLVLCTIDRDLLPSLFIFPVLFALYCSFVVIPTRLSITRFNEFNDWEYRDGFVVVSKGNDSSEIYRIQVPLIQWQ